MKPTDQPMPRARDEGLVIQELPDETLVYDLDRHKAHALNQTAAWVWRRCDGETSVAEMAQALNRELGLPPDEGAIWLALDRLGRTHLLRERLTIPPDPSRSSRRELVRKLAMAGGLALVTSVLVPTAAQASTSCVNRMQPNCTGGSGCTGSHTCVPQGMTACHCA